MTLINSNHFSRGKQLEHAVQKFSSISLILIDPKRLIGSKQFIQGYGVVTELCFMTLIKWIWCAEYKYRGFSIIRVAWDVGCKGLVGGKNITSTPLTKIGVWYHEAEKKIFKNYCVHLGIYLVFVRWRNPGSVFVTEYPRFRCFSCHK